MSSPRFTTLAVVAFAFAGACGKDRDSATGAADGGAEDTGAATADGGATAAEGGSTGPNADTTAAADDGDDDPVPPIKLDVFGIPDAPDLNGACGGGKMGGGDEPDFSYIWVANSSQSTVSKINTVTLIEEGRYMTRENSSGDPSRTSVSLNGDVAVANRNGGVLKIFARIADCLDPDNTSTGPDDVKDFPDGCVAWFTPFNYASQRPVAWAPGDYNGSTCRWENEKLWTSGANNTIDVLLLDGETGVVEQTVPIPETVPYYYGIYGGASDADGNFWGSQLGLGDLVFVDRQTFDHETWNMQLDGYGMTVDQEGRAWTCSGSGAARFDPLTETWDTTIGVMGGGGCMVDAVGRLWLANYTPQLVAVDIETLDQLMTIPIPQYTHGISIDFEGNVWGVSMNTQAYRVNPDTGTVDVVDGLYYPYTYSDMTGWALSNAVGPPPSG